jgi:polyhydroxybutyrate depolymerase
MDAVAKLSALMLRGAIAGLALCLAACASQPPAPPTAAKMSDRSLVHDGRTRSFLVHDYSGGRRAPMVIVLHGGGGNAENAVMMTGFDAIAERERFIAVYPRGTSGPLQQTLLTWNAGHCCAAAMRNRVDDVGFIGALIDAMVAEGAADPARVYVTGMSNGAMMSHRLGIELSDKVAAIAPVVGGLFGDEPAPKRGMPVLIVNGGADRIVPGAGGPVGTPGSIAAGQADRDILPARAQAEYWAKAGGCRSSAQRAIPGATVTEFRGCRGRSEVAHYIVTGNGHAWPGGRAGRAEADQPVPDFKASEVIWTFFKRHRR